MKKAIAVLLLAAIMLVGCSQKAKSHTISMDELTLTLPAQFVDCTENKTQADFMYCTDTIYVNGFQESKQELLQYFEQISFQAYVQMISENQDPQWDVIQTDELWYCSYSATLGSEDYSFLCAFYETDESFWRLQAGCLSELFDENQQILWDYITSVH